MAKSVIITCAATGGIHTPTMSPHLPITPAQIADAAVGAAEAGAAIVHLHARDPEIGKPDFRPETFMQFLPVIGESSDVVVNVSTGGGLGMTIDERLAAALHASPEMASLNMGSLNFGIFPMADKRDDPELFWFSPRDDGTLHSYKAFVDLTENFFMLDDFKAVRYEIRELQINLSRSGDVAWYHARLDDFNEWKGQPANWEDVRWTGVLEKRDGRWVIVQMHFSDASDKT